jgi:hypothetical protein
MGKGSVIAYSSADSAHPGERERAKKHTPAGQRRQNKAYNGGQMDQNEPGQHHEVMFGGAPPRPLRCVDGGIGINGSMDCLDHQGTYLRLATQSLFCATETLGCVPERAEWDGARPGAGLSSAAYRLHDEAPRIDRSSHAQV